MRESEFTWRDGERTTIFRVGAIGDSAETLEQQGWDRYDLLTTPRFLRDAPLRLPGNARRVHQVPSGPVNETAAELFRAVRSDSIVALGGGRVIDTAKAIAAVREGRVAAMPTTLSGAEMTHIHRFPEGRTGPRLIRPELVMADPLAMTSAPRKQLRASAMNALAHGADCLYTPFANPVSIATALDGAKRIATGLDGKFDHAGRTELALGAILCAAALDSALLSLHHVMSQTLVRTMRIPHAETNAAILPRAIEYLIPRAPKEMAALAKALGVKRADLPARIEKLAGGRRRLGKIGARKAKLDEALDGMLARPDLQYTPDAPDRAQLRELVEAAW